MLGTGQLTLDVDMAATPATVWDSISDGRPDLLALRPNLRCAVDRAYMDWDSALHDGAELAFIPPTAGG